MHHMAEGRFIAYHRVSTAQQGRSGLGLEAQRQAVADYLDGGAWTLVAEYTEVESGKRADRPELAKALAACRAHRAVLVIAKLDRLSRNAAFLLNLRDAGVEFVAADMPQANRLTVGILAVVAEAEAEMISARTKAALAAAKERRKAAGLPSLALQLLFLFSAINAFFLRLLCVERRAKLPPNS
jgi:DNA invertase Pin-like site-specific DNA recombinase